MKKTIGSLLISCAFFCGQVFAATTGAYTITAQTPMGEMQSTLTLNEDGTGSIQNQFGTTEFSGASINGNDFEFEMTIQTPNGDMKMNYKGTVDGDDVSGNTTSQFGESKFTGTRKN